MRSGYIKYVVGAAVLLLSQPLFAHTINYALEKAPVGHVAAFYLKLGIRHIIPDGLDHILFIAGLCLINPKIKTLLWQATAFTAAHSLTLALSMKNIIVAPAAIIEPVIALSIMFVALENLFSTSVSAWRILIVFFFGLVHGMGFAAALNETGLPRNMFYTSVISFNIGVELAQVAIILSLYFCVLRLFGKKSWYRKYFAWPASIVIALIALYWTVERVFIL